MAMNESSNTSGRTLLGRQLRTAAVVVGFLVALGYAAIPFVDHAISSPSAAARITSANAMPSTDARAGMIESAAAAAGSMQSHVLKVGSDLTDHSRECQPDAGITTACTYN
jgi:hypothetical protein